MGKKNINLDSCDQSKLWQELVYCIESESTWIHNFTKCEENVIKQSGV